MIIRPSFDNCVLSRGGITLAKSIYLFILLLKRLQYLPYLSDSRSYSRTAWSKQAERLNGSLTYIYKAQNAAVNCGKARFYFLFELNGALHP